MIDVNKMVENAMINLVIDAPVYANAIAKIGVKVVQRKDVDACAYTDSKTIYINATEIENCCLNPRWILANGKEVNCMITPKNIQFLLCHELLHIIMLTTDRAKKFDIDYDNKVVDKKEIRKFELWNQATDYEINSLLINNQTKDAYGYKPKPIGTFLEFGLYNPDYINMTAEEIYEILVEEEKRNNGGELKDPQNGYGLEEGIPQLDKHLEEAGVDEATKNEIIQRISDMFGSDKNGIGESAIDRAIERNFKEVKFNWRKALSKYINTFIKNNYTWNKPNRAGIANRLILPASDKTPSLNIGVAIDTSGSISKKQTDAMMNHLYTILHQFKSFKIDVWCCGSKVYEETLMTITNKNKEDIQKFKVKSDGGNDMRKNFSFIKDHYKGKEKINLLIIMSDFIDPLDGDTTTTSIVPCIFLVVDAGYRHNEKFVAPTKIKGVAYPFEV